MFRLPFQRPSPTKKQGVKRVPPGTTVWAVGDIHGRYDLLAPMLKAIIEDLKSTSGGVLIFLGDYVDRGPQSREVLQLLSELQDYSGFECHILRGNHEASMEASLKDPLKAPSWCEYGGRETLRSYGVAAPVQKADRIAWEQAMRELGAALPVAHIRLLERQEKSVIVGDFFFCHAGARPGVPLDRQTAHDLMWIRNDFLNDAAPFDRLIVHGHTPVVEVHSDRRRVALDTGAYATGKLTALRLENDDRRVLQTSVTDGEVKLRWHAA